MPMQTGEVILDPQLAVIDTHHHLHDKSAAMHDMGRSGRFLIRANPPFSSQSIAEEWAPYVETAVEAFGADRCMFESNLPTDETGAFATVCNAFKRMTQRCSESEKRAIFAGTAARVYRLDVSF
jgi:predicted TIM-barrel fold metal-dependent hydrolase